MERELPVFRYHPDPFATGALKKVPPVKCSVCGQKTDVVYDGPLYTVKEVDAICPWCIASGKAAKKFNGEFQDSASCDEVEVASSVDELCLRSPGYRGLQQEYWVSHCGDFCAFLGYVNWEDVLQMGIASQIEKDCIANLSIDLDEIKQGMANGGPMQGYLFRCLKCGQHRLHVDWD